MHFTECLRYFTPETKNEGGKTFRAHALTHTRIYRNLIENTGYDGMQLSNARGAEVCYNNVSNASWRGDKDQMSGISIQSMSGRCYNNVVRKFNGPGIQMGPLGNLEVFNNIVSGCPEGQPGIQFLFSLTTPEQNPNGDGKEDKMRIHIHHNVIVCNGVAVNGRNTSQVMGVHLTDNIIVYKGEQFGNMTVDTIVRWKEQSAGNTWIKQPIIDFVAIDSYKIADSANGNFAIAADSPLIKSGTGDGFVFDFRGYKSWYGTMAPAGAFMGIYKDTSIVDDPISLIGVAINNGATSTTNRDVQLKITFTGLVTKCRVSEASDFAGASWINVSDGVVGYTLTEAFELKTLYVQVSGGASISNTRTASIELQAIPLSLDSVIVNDGRTNSRHLTVSVLFTFSGSFVPVQYRLSEETDLTSAIWVDMSEDITYTFATVGDKQLYAQLRDVHGNMSNLNFGEVTIADLAPVAIVSFGWSNAEIAWTTPGLTIFDSSLAMTRFNNQHTASLSRTIYDNYGEVFAAATQSTNSIHMFTHPTTEGGVTGDDSGVFPDTYLKHVSVWAGNTQSSANIAFSNLSPGQYKVSLLCNTIIKQMPKDSIYYKAVTDSGETSIAPPNAGVQNNTSVMTTPVTVKVGDDGLLKIEFGITGTVAGYWYAPLNIIKIEQI